MSDRARIDIDCESGRVSSDVDQLRSVAIGSPAEVTRSSLITQLFIPQIMELMNLSKDELMKRHLAMLLK